VSRFAENIRRRKPQFLQDVFHATQCGGLLPVDEAVERGLGNAQIFGQLGVAPISAQSFQEFGKCLVKTGHPSTLARNTFRMRMIFLIRKEGDADGEESDAADS